MFTKCTQHKNIYLIYKTIHEKVKNRKHGQNPTWTPVKLVCSRPSIETILVLAMDCDGDSMGMSVY